MLKEHIRKLPYYLWCFIVLLFVVATMEIRHLPPEVEKYIFIEDLQQASEKRYKTDDYSLEYYPTKEKFLTALENDYDVKESYFNYITDKIDDPAKNRRYAKLTLYYEISTSYTIRHNIWLTIRTVNGRPDSVFEIILSRMVLNDLFTSRSIDGRTYVLNHTNGRISTSACFTVYPDAVQKIAGTDDVYYESLLSEDRKKLYPLRYSDEREQHRYYRQFHEIQFMEMQ